MSDEIGGRGRPHNIRDSLFAAKEAVNRDTPELYEFGPFRLEPAERKLFRGSEVVVLTPKAFDMLVLLVRHSDHLLEKEELMRVLWPDSFVEEGNLSNNIFLLRKALGEDPLYIETVPKRGYRFVGTVRQLPNVIPLRPGKPLGGKSELLKRRKLGMGLAAGIAAIVLAAGGTWYLRSQRATQIDAIAVLPFTNGGGDANTEYLSDGITESLIDNLARVPQLKVKSRNTVFHYKGKDIDAQKVGSDLGVSATVNGRVVPRGDNIEVSAEVIDVRDNSVIWGQHYSGKSADIISLQQQIAGDIADKLRSKLSSSEKQQVANQGTQNPEAYELYLKGRYAWNKRTPSDLAAAISYFNQAIAKDPSYAVAYSGLAETYNVLPNYGGTPSETYPKSNAAARKAVELDPTLARPHAILGSNAVEYDWDFQAGEAELKKAVELDPNDATVRSWYAEKLLEIPGKQQEALAEVNRARQLDPLSPMISFQAGTIYTMARRYDEAIAVCRKLADDNPTFAKAHDCLIWAYGGKGMYPQVIEEWKTYARLSGDRNESEFAGALEQGFRSAGWKGALTKGIAIRQQQRKTGYWSAYNIACMYAELGDTEQAFRWLNTAYRERDLNMIALKVDFPLDPLRSDPRFDEVVRKVGLPQ
jgi:TolB-like protein/DNA-binding winged helix-turn-helix (wHTH) protein/Flp pilus assembly protein TadD